MGSRWLSAHGIRLGICKSGFKHQYLQGTFYPWLPTFVCFLWDKKNTYTQLACFIDEIKKKDYICVEILFNPWFVAKLMICYLQSKIKLLSNLYVHTREAFLKFKKTTSFKSVEDLKNQIKQNEDNRKAFQEI